MCEGKYNFKMEDNSNRNIFIMCQSNVVFNSLNPHFVQCCDCDNLFFFAFIFKTTLMSLEIRKGQLIINNAQSVNIHIDLTL